MAKKCLEKTRPDGLKLYAIVRIASIYNENNGIRSNVDKVRRPSAAQMKNADKVEFEVKKIGTQNGRVTGNFFNRYFGI